MRKINFKLANEEYTEEIIYGVNDFPYDELRPYKVVSKNRRKYVDKIATFDIETTTIENVSRETTPYGFMYNWQFCIDEKVVMGRTWDEYKEFLDRVTKKLYTSNKKHLVVYVHNLSFEFQFIREFFEWESVFAKERREVLKAVDIDGVEYRCSYYLTNMSFEKACEYAKHCKYQKLGNYDYKKIRYPWTFLSDDELAYCFCDVRGLYEVIEDFLQYDILATIPMTSTGFVRRDCSNAMRKNPENRKLFLRTRMDEEQYKILNELKRGGNTHANRGIVGIILKNVRNYDISSSYPFQLMTQYYPITAFDKYGTPDSIAEFEKLLQEYCCMFRVAFKNLKLIYTEPVPYISYHKLLKRSGDEIVYNGRVMYSSSCLMSLTEIDFEILKKQYTWDEIAVSDVYIAKRGEIPEELKNQIMEYYTAKTELKDVDDYLYAKSKNKLNSIFGMCCTDPVHDVIYFEDEAELGHGEWKVDKGDVPTELEKYYKSRNSFLPIQWGIWVTAHARKLLQKAIDLSAENTLYNDTDSDKVQGMEDGWLDELNKELKETAVKYGAYAKDKHGKVHYMGVFDEEKPYKYFLTWGTKKYAYIQENKKGEDELHITIAGVHKEWGAKYLKEHGGLKALKPGFIFPNQKSGGGTTSYWNDEPIHELMFEGKKIITASNVGIVDSSYTLGSTGIFAENEDFTRLFI